MVLWRVMFTTVQHRSDDWVLLLLQLCLPATCIDSLLQCLKRIFVMMYLYPLLSTSRFASFVSHLQRGFSFHVDNYKKKLTLLRISRRFLTYFCFFINKQLALFWDLFYTMLLLIYELPLGCFFSYHFVLFLLVLAYRDIWVRGRWGRRDERNRKRVWLVIQDRPLARSYANVMLL